MQIIYTIPMDSMKPWPALAPYGKTIPLSGGELFYYDSAGGADSAGNADSGEDSGKPVVVLIHGLGDEADSWRHIFPLLTAAGYRVIAPDLPGFGRSRWKGGINLRVHAKAVIRLMAVTGAASAERPAIFAGSSLGAGIAELAAFKRPDLVKGLILIDGCYPFSSRSARADSAGKGFLLMALPFFGKGWYRKFRTNHEGAWKSLFPYYHDLNAMSEADKNFLRERVIARVESANQERGYFATIRSMNLFFLLAQQSAAGKLKKLPVKILLLWGEHDRVFPAAKVNFFRSLRPDAAFAVIAGAGHLPHQEKPAELAAEMLRFL